MNCVLQEYEKIFFNPRQNANFFVIVECYMMPVRNLTGRRIVIDGYDARRKRLG